MERRRMIRACRKRKRGADGGGRWVSDGMQKEDTVPRYEMQEAMQDAQIIRAAMIQATEGQGAECDVHGAIRKRKREG
jgi:hypothetical protein